MSADMWTAETSFITGLLQILILTILKTNKQTKKHKVPDLQCLLLLVGPDLHALVCFIVV